MGDFHFYEIESFTPGTASNNMYTEVQIIIWKSKALKWDALEERISECYVTEGAEGEMVENNDPDIDLGTIGEIAASAFGFL